MTQQVLLGEGANLTQRNLWVDDCVQGQTMPYMCFAVAVTREPQPSVLALACPL